MKRIIIFKLVLVLLLSSFILSCSAGAPKEGRIVEILNSQWKFHKGDIDGAEAKDFNDVHWRTLDLPHDWSVEGPYDSKLASCTGYLPGGIGWYRKSIEMPSASQGKSIYICFEGIYRNGEVFINGNSLGMRPNGYISYIYDLTPFIRYGEKNTIAVRVDHSKSADSRWYTGSGISRDVTLLTVNPVHIENWGVYFTTPEVSEKQAVASVRTSVENSGSKQAFIKILNELIDKNGHAVSKSSEDLTVPANEKGAIAQELIVTQPDLWSIEDPSLYILKTSIYQGKNVIDSSVRKVGIRTLEFDANTGFSLNGKNMKVKGVCLHHDSGCLGAAVYRDVWHRRLETLKSLGCNAIRTSHNPRSPVIYDLCDELGLLVLDEAFDEWEYPKKKWLKGWNVGKPGFQGPSEFFKEWAETDLRDMILRDRNHPSIFMWSIGNEVDYPNDPYSHPILDEEGIDQQHTRKFLPDQPNAERLGGIAKKLAAIVREADFSRPVTAGLAGPVMSNETDYPGELDVCGYNYTERRYAMDHKKYPERVLYGSENRHDFEAWKAVRDNEYIFGQFLWTGIDYLGESHPWPSRGFSSGLLNLGGFKKPRAYFRESLWLTKPMIYCGTYKKKMPGRNSLSIDALPIWNYQEGEMIRVVVYTNCRKAKLLLNGEEVGEPKVYDDKTGVLFWDIPFKPGKLQAVGYNSDKVAAHYVIATSDDPHTIQTTVWKDSVSHEGVAQIEIQIADKNGNPVVMADNEITCSITGPLKLIGLEAGDPKDMGDYTDHKQKVNDGRMIAYLKPTGKKGIARVRFLSPGLEKAVVEIVVH